MALTFKEKNKYLRDLHAPVHVTKDLALLKQLDPFNDLLPSFEYAPERHAERVLYVLLDIATPEQIRNNRRTADQKKTEKPLDIKGVIVGEELKTEKKISKK